MDDFQARRHRSSTGSAFCGQNAFRSMIDFPASGVGVPETRVWMISAGLSRACRRLLVLALVIAPVACGLSGRSVSAAEQSVPTGFIDSVYQDETGPHRYVVFVPRNYSPRRAWPVILFLHGAGERGSDGREQLSVGLGPIVRERAADFPYLVVFPQAEQTRGRILDVWRPESSDGKRALKILDEVEQRYRVDSAKRILTGWSMGGYGTWAMAAADPKKWSAVVPIAGGGRPQDAGKLARVPLWAIHGAVDDIVLPEESRQMIAAVRTAGGQPRYSEIPAVGHDVWSGAYRSRELWQWLADPTPGGSSELSPESGHWGTARSRTDDDELPFRPALEIPRAVAVRFGNDMLKAVAYSVPRVISDDVLAGRIPDIRESTTVADLPFQILFRDIRYRGTLQRAYAKAYQTDRLNIQLAMSNLQMQIGRSFVQGESRSAVAGPITVIVGHRRPVWLSIDVTPEVVNRRLRLKVVGTRFNIEPDNFFVSPPAGVTADGWGMTEERVSKALMEGIYARRNRLEREALAAVPGIIQRIEQALPLNDVKDVVDAFWPLPVYRPRLRIWPQEVSTDDRGVTLVMGLTVAAVGPGPVPAQPKVVAPLGPPASEMPRGTKLDVSVAPNMLEPLTAMLVEAGVARIHVLDIPESSLHALADRRMLEQAVPDLRRLGRKYEVATELILAKPLAVSGDAEVGSGNRSGRRSETVAVSLDEESSEAETSSGAMQFHLRGVTVEVSIRPAGTQEAWQPWARFDLAIRQQVEAELNMPDRQPAKVASLQLEWAPRVQFAVQGRFAESAEPQDETLNAEVIRAAFEKGWLGWTALSSASRSSVPDVDFGFSRLSPQRVAWREPHLTLRFAEPGVLISNRSQLPLQYQTKGPYSGWSEWLILPPGQQHSFGVSHPVLFRSRGQATQTWLLPVGSHSVYDRPRDGVSPRLMLLPTRPAKPAP